MHSKRMFVFPIVLLLLLALMPLSVAMAQDATEEPVEPAATEEVMEESTSEEDVEVTDVTIEAPEVVDESPAEATPESVTIVPADADGVGSEPGAGDGAPIRYTIVQGDTLFSIARRYDVSVTALAEFNDIVNPNRIFWGQIIEIPQDFGTGGPGEPDDPLRTYQVREGDTLFRIAANNGTTVTRLLELNPEIDNVNVIFIGQDILVPRQ